MRSLYMITVFLCVSVPSFSQTKTEKDTTRMLPNSAFNRMVINNDITYAIVGENTPVSGVKVDVSKPEGTISGMFPVKNCPVIDILGFELKGGVIDKNFSLFKGYTSANSAYEFRGSFTYIPPKNGASYSITPQGMIEKKVVRTRNIKVREDIAKVKDTMYVVFELYRHHLKADKDVNPLASAITPKDDHKKIAAHFIATILKKSVTANGTWDEVIGQFPQVTEGPLNTYVSNTFYNTITLLYDKYNNLYKNIDVVKLDKQIENAKTVWTKKNYFWITISPFVRTEKVNEYYTFYQGIDSTYIKAGYRWYYGAAGYVNWYKVVPKKISLLFRIGASVSHNNNISNLSSYEFESRTPFFSNDISHTDKVKRGLAYNHADINTGVDKHLITEFYLLPLSKPIPGLYLSGDAAHSSLYKLPKIVDRADDKIKIAVEAGLVFNINNREKDKTLVSILTYFRFEDLTDGRRTDLQTGISESRQDFRERNINMGIRVGIPINLPAK